MNIYIYEYIYVYVCVYVCVQMWECIFNKSGYDELYGLWQCVGSFNHV